MTDPIYDIVPAEIRAFVSSPPLLATENRAAYGELFRSMAMLLEPKNLVDWLRLRDLVDSAWQTLRMRHLKTGLLDIHGRRAVHMVLMRIQSALPAGQKYDCERLAAGYSVDPNVKAKVNTLLSKHGLNESCIAAQAFMLSARLVESADRLESNSINRRERMLREVGWAKKSDARPMAQFAVVERAETVDDCPPGVSKILWEALMPSGEIDDDHPLVRGSRRDQ
jgi:hypothetical protein